MRYDWIYLIEKLNRRRSDLNISSENELISNINNNVLSNEDLLEAFKELRLKLGEHMRLGHVIFLFGNGTSIYAGSKSTMDFTLQKYAQNTEFVGIKEELDKVCSSVKGIEEQLNALNTIRSYNKIIQNADKEKCVSELINKIKEQLITSYVNSIDYTNLKLHKYLLLKLRSFGALPRTQIYTTNYDLAFEYTMDSLGIEYTDGFSGFVNRRFDPRSLTEDGKPSLVKIHGSVNWINEKHRIKEIQPKFIDGKLVIDDTAPVLIYPTSDKLYQTYSTPYSELMRHMLDEMETGSNVVLVFGYKYGDDHVNEILYKALENPKNIFYFFIYGTLGECDFLQKKINILEKSMPNINILSGYIFPAFNVFVTRILPAAVEITDEQKALAYMRMGLSAND